MILDPTVTVECNICCEQEKFGMTPLARGAFDERGLVGAMAARGWWTDPANDNYQLCEGCKHDRDDDGPDS